MVIAQSVARLFFVVGFFFVGLSSATAEPTIILDCVSKFKAARQSGIKKKQLPTSGGCEYSFEFEVESTTTPGTFQRGSRWFFIIGPRVRQFVGTPSALLSSFGDLRDDAGNPIDMTSSKVTYFEPKYTNFDGSFDSDGISCNIASRERTEKQLFPYSPVLRAVDLENRTRVFTDSTLWECRR